MKKGDLRRFYDDVGTLAYYTLGGGSSGTNKLSGRTFMILTTTCGYSVEILLDGQVVRPFNYSWIQDNSEMISESR